MAEHMLQLERRVLGTLLAEPYLIGDSALQEEFFQSAGHRTIFRAMLKLMRAQKPIDFATILTCVEPGEVGGANYIADLTMFAHGEKLDDYIALLSEQRVEREKHRILQLAHVEDWSIHSIQEAFDGLMQGLESPQEFSIQPALIDMAERPFVPAKRAAHVATNLPDLDSLLDGFKPAELTIIAARPSMGKTDLLNHLAIQAGMNGHLPIIFSLEMSKASMIDRIISAIGSYNRLKMRDPFTYFSDAQKHKWYRVLQEVDLTRIQIDDRSLLTVEQMRAAMRKMMSEHPDKKPIVFIDYLQIMHTAAPHRLRSEMIGDISSRLKQLAKDFHCPVVCLSQLNRAVESRDNKRPILSDLRDSGNIEQDADVIAFLYRDDYYDSNSPIKNILELHIAKHRNGPTGRVIVHYTKETGFIRGLTAEEKEWIYRDYSA